jgi:hypothetical protein
LIHLFVSLVSGLLLQEVTMLKVRSVLVLMLQFRFGNTRQVLPTLDLQHDQRNKSAGYCQTTSPVRQTLHAEKRGINRPVRVNEVPVISRLRASKNTRMK